MRIATVFFPEQNREKLLGISKALARGMESQGHQVDLIDGTRDVNTKLTIYEYIAIGCEQTNLFGGKIPVKASRFLKESGIVGGKRCFAYVSKKAFGAQRTLGTLMKTMEAEGMFLKFSEILSSPEEAEEIGKRLAVG